MCGEHTSAHSQASSSYHKGRRTVAAALGDDGLAGVVARIDVHVGQVAWGRRGLQQAHIRQANGKEADAVLGRHRSAASKPRQPCWAQDQTAQRSAAHPAGRRTTRSPCCPAARPAATPLQSGQGPGVGMRCSVGWCACANIVALSMAFAACQGAPTLVTANHPLGTVSHGRHPASAPVPCMPKCSTALAWNSCCIHR